MIHKKLNRNGLTKKRSGKTLKQDVHVTVNVSVLDLHGNDINKRRVSACRPKQLKQLALTWRAIVLKQETGLFSFILGNVYYCHLPLSAWSGCMLAASSGLSEAGPAANTSDYDQHINTPPDGYKETGR